MDITIGHLKESDLPAADRIFRLSFGKFLGLPDPLRFGGDKDYIRQRWAADPAAAFGAEIDGELVASNFGFNSGSVGHFGPLTIHPDFWDRGIAKPLIKRTMELLDSRGITYAELVTFADNPKHLSLYQNFGFWPRFLTAIMYFTLKQTGPAPGSTRYSEVADSERAELLKACREVTESIYDGLDLEHEIRAVDTQGLGDTVLLWDHEKLAGLAVCRSGPGTEAGSGACLVKFGAVRPGPNAGRLFDLLLDACEAHAAAQGMSRLFTGVNTARHEAYRKMIERGFRTEVLNISMSRPNEPGYNRPDVNIIDDWR